MADYVIRHAVVDDAEQCILHMTQMSYEPNNGILTGPGEFNYTLEQERQIIQEHADADNGAFIVAEATPPMADGTKVIGLMGIHGGRRAANRHSAGLGISVHKDWRNRGLGTAMMHFAIDWAKSTGVVTRLELEVFHDNTRARHVYEKLGFQVEGVKRKAFFKDGEFKDSYIMALLL